MATERFYFPSYVFFKPSKSNFFILRNAGNPGTLFLEPEGGWKLQVLYGIIGNMHATTCKVDNQGRVMLPLEWRKRANIGPSTELYVHEEAHGALLLETAQQGLARAQKLVAQYVSPDAPSLAGELIKDRRKEAKRESR